MAWFVHFSVDIKLWVATVRAVLTLIMTRFFNAIFLSLFILGAPAVRANESLYQEASAHVLNKDRAFSLFGPRAPKIKYDNRMIRAAEIAQARARAHSTRRCWSYVKTALVQADVIDSRPETGYAKQAAQELQRNFGFKRVNISDPFKAPVGSVLVYGGKGAGHVEIRTTQGFVSDFESKTPSPRPLIGVFIKPS